MAFSMRRWLVAALSRKEAGVGYRDWRRLRFSYAQYGEDIVVEALVPELRGFYVDVGAFHPVQFSNTYLFYRKGWRGLNVEANPDALPEFHRKRPGDRTIQAVLSNVEEEREFHVFETGE